MIDAFDRAEHWRSRARELRKIARSMQEAEVRINLLAIADGVENHAQALEGMAITLHCTAQVFHEETAEALADAAD
jgi:hypothetical protein